MKSTSIRTLKKISKELQIFLSNNNNLCVDRTRKNDIIDAILYKLYYTEISSTQEKATIKLNDFKHKTNKTSRQSLVKKEKKLDVYFYEKLSNFLSDLIKKNTNTNANYTRQIIAVDGTYPTLLNTITKDGYKSNKNENSVTPLVSGLFNITSNYPVILDLVKTKNERTAFINFVKNKDKFKNNIFVFDRGYVSDNLFDYMDHNELFFICRLRENNKYISDNYDRTVISDKNVKMRIITYKIKDKTYYMATNVFDCTPNLIKSIYHDRWKIEEYYKYIKQNMKLAKINEKRENDIIKTISAHLIVSQITFLFVNMFKKHDNVIVNKSVLTTGIYGKFLYNFFNNQKFTKYFLLNFINVYIQYVNSKKDRTFKHQCKRPNYRWYFKKYFKNEKSKNI